MRACWASARARSKPRSDATEASASRSAAREPASRKKMKARLIRACAAAAGQPGRSATRTAACSAVSAPSRSPSSCAARPSARCAIDCAAALARGARSRAPGPHPSGPGGVRRHEVKRVLRGARGCSGHAVPAMAAMSGGSLGCPRLLSFYTDSPYTDVQLVTIVAPSASGQRSRNGPDGSSHGEPAVRTDRDVISGPPGPGPRPPPRRRRSWPMTLRAPRGSSPRTR